MAQSKYKRHSRGGRFRQQGDGLRSAIDNIRQQRQIEIDSLKTLALQQKEQDSLQISGLRNVSKNEAENKNILQNLENKIYQNKRNAISVKADRDVDSILGKAKELGKESEFWEEFSSTHADKYAKMASGLFDLAQYNAAINAYESMSDDQKKIAEASYENSYRIVEDEMGKSIIEIDSLKDRKDLITNTVGWLANNRHLHNKLANDYLQTSKSRQDFLRSAKAKDGTPLYNKDTASQMTMNAAYNYCFTNGIPLNSQAGQKIISNAKQMAVVETTSLTKSYNFKTDQEDIQEHLGLVKDAYKDINRAATKPYKTKYGASISGRISGQEEFYDSLYLLYHIVEGSHVKGTDGSILAPGHPSRQAETPKQKWERVLNLAAEGIDFKTVADGIDALNIPVRNMNTGKVVLNKKGKPAEYIFDKHPEMKTEAIRILKLKQENSISDREAKIRKDQVKEFADIIAPLDTDLDNNDFSNSLLNKDWVLSTSQWALDSKNKNTAESNYILDILGQSPELFSKNDFTDNIVRSMKVARVDNEFLSGDANGGLFAWTQVDVRVPRQAKYHEALVAANKIPDFSKEVKNFITNEFAGNIAGGITAKNIANENDLLEMIDKGIGRFMVVWASKSDVVDVDARFELTKEVLDKEISDGLNKQTGWASATEIGDTGDLVLGYRFAAIENKNLPTEREYTVTDINNLFSSWEKENKNLTSSTIFKLGNVNESKVNGVLTANFDKLVTLEDSYRLLNAISTGEASNELLPKNLAKFIAVTKGAGYNLTTREVMNMVIDHIKENGDTIWTKDQTIDSQFKDYDYEWPAHPEDLVKKSCNITPPNTADGIGIKFCQYYKDRGIDLNQSIINEYFKNRGRFD